MHAYQRYFPVRSESDQLDAVSVLALGLQGDARRLLVQFEGEPWSVGKMSERVAVIRRWLARCGLKRGDRVATMLLNSPDHVALIYALILSGLVWVPINTRYKSASVAYLLGHCRPLQLICEAVFEPVVAQALAETAHRCDVKQLPSAPPGELTETLQDTPLQVVASQPSEPLCIIYTSGTTGAPKGVILTQRMMRIASEAAMIVADVHETDRLLLWEPLCHIGGAQMLLIPFLVRAELHLVAGFSASRFWSQVKQSGVTQLHYLGGILDILMGLPASEQLPVHSLRIAWGAGVSAQAWQPITDRMGFALRECYGMTEGSSFATVNLTGRPGSIGMALPWITLELLGDDGRPVGPGETGQIVLSSDVEGVFLPAYLDNPEASAQTLRDGKLHTGDMARQDAEGYLYFVGRRTDSMRVRGENVSAWEIEHVFALHPAVAAVAAVGVQSDVGEQEILLYVQYRPGVSENFSNLAAWADDALAVFQRPRYYAEVKRFELTPSERIRKHLLSRDLAATWDRRHDAGAAGRHRAKRETAA